jgi:hypothetical protein
VTKLFSIVCMTTVVLALSATASAQEQPAQAAVSAAQNPTAAAQQAADDAERLARRFRLGVQGGVGLDPELIDVGVHAIIGPVFNPALQLRPSLEIGFGELTTMLAINIEGLYTFPGFAADTRWIPYVGGGPSFGLSHRGFEADDPDNVDVDIPGQPDNDDLDDRSRFDFSDTDFEAGMNFIVGMRNQRGTFFEMKATAWGVSNVRLLAGFNF